MMNIAAPFSWWLTGANTLPATAAFPVDRTETVPGSRSDQNLRFTHSTMGRKTTKNKMIAVKRPIAVPVTSPALVLTNVVIARDTQTISKIKMM
jgi:hypothetical protein